MDFLLLSLVMNLLIYIWLGGFQEASVGVKFQCLSIAVEVFPSRKLYTCIFCETTSLSLLLSHTFWVVFPKNIFFRLQTCICPHRFWTVPESHSLSLLMFSIFQFIIFASLWVTLYFAWTFPDGSGSFISVKIATLWRITTPATDQNNALLGSVICTNQVLTVSRMSLAFEQF